ncbi:MAG: hypothetical protein HWN69_09685, partial [Desulfobacterales bacterium]|nr:hypothetical protein [Desulfobacterales bacterium]
MDKRSFAPLAVLIALALALSALLPAGQALSKDDSAGSPTGQGKGKKVEQLQSRPSGWKKGEKEDWKSEFPPGWENWDDAKRQQWKHGLERARVTVRRRTEARLNAALHALEMAARKGAPLHQAERMAKAGLDRGLGPFDFEPLGKLVVEKVKEGVKGEELARVIHEEIDQRRQQRQRLRELMKERIKQRRQDWKLKEKKDPGKPPKGKSLDKKGQ